MIWDFSVIQQKHPLVCPDLFVWLISQFLYHTPLLLPKLEIDETVSFRDSRKLFSNKFFAYFGKFWYPIFKWDKRNEVVGHRSMLQWLLLIHCIGEVNVATTK